MTSHTRNVMLWTLAAAALVAAAVVYGTFDPSTHYFPRCPFLTVTGLKCPGCGSQRAIHALLHLRWADALAYNALLLPAIPVILLMFAAQARKHRWPRLYNALNSRPAILATLAVVLTWWLVRNLAGI